MGDSRAVICRNGKASQLSVDHEPSVERKSIENRGGFVTNFPGKFEVKDFKLTQIKHCLITNYISKKAD